AVAAGGPFGGAGGDPTDLAAIGAGIYRGAAFLAEQQTVGLPSPDRTDLAASSAFHPPDVLPAVAVRADCPVVTVRDDDSHFVAAHTKPLLGACDAENAAAALRDQARQRFDLAA